MPRRPALYPRPRWQWAEDMPHGSSDWAEVLQLSDVTFLTENQVSLWVAPEHVGVDKVWFYPVPRAPHLEGDRYDVERIAGESIHVLHGPGVHVFRHGAPVSWEGEPKTVWQPHAVKREFRSNGLRLAETVCVLEDMVAVWVKPEGDVDGLHLRCQASTDRTRAASWRAYDETQVCLHEDGVANGWVWLGSSVDEWHTTKTRHCLSFEAGLPKEGGLIVLMLGYDQAAVERRLESMLAQMERPHAGGDLRQPGREGSFGVGDVLHAHGSGPARVPGVGASPLLLPDGLASHQSAGHPLRAVRLALHVPVEDRRRLAVVMEHRHECHSGAVAQRLLVGRIPARISSGRTAARST